MPSEMTPTLNELASRIDDMNEDQLIAAIKTVGTKTVLTIFAAGHPQLTHFALNTAQARH